MQAYEDMSIWYEKETSPEQDLTFLSAERWFALKGLPFGMEAKRSLGMLDDDGKWTNLALILSEESPFGIHLEAFPGTERDIPSESIDMKGAVLDIAEKAYDWIERHDPELPVPCSMQREEPWEYPKPALREALLNTLVHRDYTSDDPVRITFFSDRLELESPGRLVPKMEIDDMMLGRSQLRNGALGRVFYELELIEAYGCGVDRIMMDYRELPLQPLFEERENSFRLTLPNRSLFLREPRKCKRPR